MLDFEPSMAMKYAGQEIPDYTQETLENYLIRGFAPGSFVTAMLAMDMERALYSADTLNRQMLWGIGRWIMENCPPGSWGNYDVVNDWINDVNGRRTSFAKAVEQGFMWKKLMEI